ncbi:MULTISPECIES: DoxX family protein [Saccharopolyspora]|uniref:DoxX family membrane protein n=1 Tax=Saccharopolyspora gregorii TaxID=33914 RepID=A0ABP6RZK4_9PSEU|nr:MULTISPECIES: DoxX family protein [Saccharopolyspora]MCA1187832.1 DoxX family protein [Saccharopolyspora sp. 6T]MCA1193806.1 DoxX family protein [Saccharopolyspora sp. 6V]MCA1227013.1 DoxX family protein [Saccharopolyspora sp. 6M]MCA1281757.1 DoxX family protein [Saccharopolyspora sp. 7B]
MLIRRLARPLLAAIFISGGINALRDAEGHSKAAAPFLDKTVGKVEDSLPEQVPTDAVTLVKLDGAVKLGAGVLLALGKAPRLSSVLLASSLVPTTLAGHAFWEIDDPQERAGQQIHFFKNLGLIGGLLIAAVDTEGKPSVAYRAKHGASRVAEQTQLNAKAAKKVARRAKRRAQR